MKTTTSLFITLCVFFLFTGFNSVFSQTTDSLLTFYTEANNKEKRLVDFMDTPEVLRIKIQQLFYINESRSKKNLAALQLDILACRVANKMAKEASEEKFWGHWNTRGEKPYHRYHLAGGEDHVSENAYAFWSSEKIEPSLELGLEMMQQGHDSFMAEKAPNDGHKKTILTASHNFVGIGYFFSENNFRYYEEFIDRYCTFDIAFDNSTSKRIQLKVSSDTNLVLVNAFLTREKKLKKKRPFFLKLKGGYLDGTRKFVMADLPAPVYVNNTKTYHLTFYPKKPGTYYVHTNYKTLEKGRKKGKEFQTSGQLIYLTKE